MSVEIKDYNVELKERFDAEAKRLREILGSDVVIEHVGSSAVGIGGKNIVDILVGVGSTDRMAVVRDLLASAGYREGHDTHPDRIFMAFRIDDDGVDRETGEGDYHVHIVVVGSEEYLNMLRLRDYLRAHPEEARTLARYAGGLSSKVPVVGNAMSAVWGVAADAVDMVAPTPEGYGGALIRDNILDAEGDPKKFRTPEQRVNDYNRMLDAMGSSAPRRATGNLMTDLGNGLTVGESVRGKADWEIEAEENMKKNGLFGTQSFGNTGGSMTIVNNNYYGAGFNQHTNGGDTPR